MNFLGKVVTQPWSRKYLSSLSSNSKPGGHLGDDQRRGHQGQGPGEGEGICQAGKGDEEVWGQNWS
jgi:hypothetical protein